MFKDHYSDEDSLEETEELPAYWESVFDSAKGRWLYHTAYGRAVSTDKDDEQLTINHKTRNQQASNYQAGSVLNYYPNLTPKCSCGVCCLELYSVLFKVMH